MNINTYIITKLLTMKTSTLNIIRKTGKLLGLNKDVFEKSNKKIEQNIIHEGDKYEHIPGSITIQEDLSGMHISKIKFYKEDIEKMKTMSDQECLNYKKYLIEHQKYKL